MTQMIESLCGSHEVQEADNHDSYRVFDKLLDDMQLEKIGKDLGARVLTLAHDDVDVRYMLLEQLNNNNELDLSQIAMPDIVSSTASIDPAVAIWEQAVPDVRVLGNLNTLNAV